MKSNLTIDPSRWLPITGYITLAAVYLVSMADSWGRRPTEQLVTITALFGLFTLLQTRLPAIEAATLSRKRAFFAAASFLVFALLWSVPYGGGYIPILFVILVAQIFLEFDAREAFAWMLAFLPLIAIPLFVLNTPVNAILTTVIYLGAFMFFGAVTTSFRREQTARERSERLLRDLEAAHAQLREYAARVEALAVAEERTRVAREMHDSLGHHLSLLSVQLQAASKLIALDPRRAATEIEKARAVAANTLQDVRQSVSTLRATSASGLRPAEAIPHLIQEFREATGIMVNYQADASLALDALSAAQSLTLFRAAQEGLTNVQKHAHASRVDVALECASQAVRLRVVDNGVGDHALGRTKATDSGFGLMGLRERVELLGGTLTVGQHDGAGFELCVEVPIQGKASA